MKRILSALMIGVMTVVGGVVGKTALKRFAPGMITQSAKKAATQGAKATGKAAKSTKAQKGAAATVTSGAAAGAATQIHDTDDNGQLVEGAEAHEPTENGTTSEPADSNERYRKRDLADTSEL